MVEESWGRGRRHAQTFQTHHSRPQALSSAEILAVERLTSVLEGNRIREGITPNADTYARDRSTALQYVHNYQNRDLDFFTLPPQMRNVLEQTLGPTA